MQLKLDELIRVNQIARNSLIDLEEMSDTDVERVRDAFAALASTDREERQGAARASVALVTTPAKRGFHHT